MSVVVVKKERIKVGPYKDITNQVFGRWHVKEWRGYHGHDSLWQCVCTCGKEALVRGTSLRSGQSKSCGCLRGDVARENNSLPPGVAAFNETYSNVRSNALLRQLSWKLSKKKFRELTSSDCAYCGSPPAKERHSAGGSYISNGLDRVNNSKGYTIDNTVPCCWICNRAKLDMNVDDFVSWIKQAHRHIMGGD